MRRFSCLVFPALIAFAFLPHAAAQDIRLYSEFERFDPFGSPVAADRDLAPREILSPAMARNGHLALHVVITGPPQTSYLLYAETNPPGILQVRVYREHFSRCGVRGYCPDWLTPQNMPAFGTIPEYDHELEEADRGQQTTRCYLLDIWAPPDTPPRRVRVEALLKIGTWYVAPLEVRIVEGLVPDVSQDSDVTFAENVAPLETSASLTAHIQLQRYLDGLPVQLPASVLRVRDVIQRNAAEDMLLAQSLETRREGPHPGTWGLNLLSWLPFSYPELGAEWYLRVRDFLYRFGD